MLLSCGNLGFLGESCGEVFHMNVLHERVEFSFSVALFFVSFAGNSDSDSVRKIPDAL